MPFYIPVIHGLFGLTNSFPGPRRECKQYIYLYFLKYNGRSIRINSLTERDESAVNVHGILILEVQHVYLVLRTKVASHPLDAEIVGYLRKRAFSSRF